MSFKTKCNQCVINKSNIPQNYEYCKSFNEDHAIDENTKVIIVGTLTPHDGRQNGYFYSARKNPTYGILDDYFGQNKFLELKSKLISNPQDKNVIKKIKKELQNKHIAFLDVVKEAISPILSPADDDIDSLILDYGSFRNINTNIVFICNSLAAEYALCKIQKKNNTTNTILYAPQIARIKKEDKQSRWKNVLDKAFTIEKN